MGDRCTGHCCRAFYLPPTVETLAERGDVQALLVLSMRRALLPGSSVPRSDAPTLAADELGKYFTCAHVQPNGDCGIYATRPDMCARYPYGKRCVYPGCTWDEALALPEPEQEPTP